MDMTSSRTTLFGDSNSRPGSRASSTATDALGASRSLLRDVDHIKSLISRASISSKPNESSITSQVFRRAPPQAVSQTQIVLELDALRRRIKYETHKPTLEPELEAEDPETDTDDEFHDAIDEGHEEVETVQNQLHRARQQEEQIIEDAEARVDRLTDENEHLQSQLSELRQETVAASTREKQLVESGEAHNATILRSESAHADQIQQLKDAQSEDNERNGAKQVQDKHTIEKLEQEMMDQKVEFENRIQDLETLLTSSRKHQQDEVQHMKESCKQEVEKVKSDADTTAKTQLEEKESLDREWKSKLSEAQVKHEALAKQVEQKYTSEVQSLQKLLDSTKADHERETQQIQELHEADREKATRYAEEQVAQCSQHHQSELDGLKAQHEQVIRQNEQELKDELEVSQKQLEALRTQLNTVQQHAAEESRAKVDDLVSRHEAQIQSLREEWTSQSKSTAADHKSALDQVAEATASNKGSQQELQARIDALTVADEEHRSSRRHLEEMLQEKTHEAIQAVEGSKSREREIMSLEQQLETLNKKHERTEHTLKELQETIEEHETLASDQTSRVNDELKEFRKQVHDAQEQRKTVQSDIDAKLREQVELARQNDFLTKQLASLGEHMNQAGQPRIEYSSTATQTSPRIQVIGSPGQSSHKRQTSTSNGSPSKNTASSPVRTKRTSIVFGPELATDAPGSPLARRMLRVDDQYPTPESPGLRHKQWSLQDYVERETVEELPSTITANEALLAQKFREHTSDLQHARDRLARQYQDRFDALLADRKRLEKQVTLEQAAEFVKDREHLAEQFEASEKEAVVKQEMRTAEQRLVQQYHKRIAKRKSQIRLKHADDFHNLAQDYDQHLQDLLWQRTEIESNLFNGSQAHDEPARTTSERSSDDTARPRPEQRLSPAIPSSDAKDGVSRLPRRTPTSMRSTSMIPRMSSHSDIKDGLQAPSKPLLSRKSSEDMRAHSPVKQRSLLRMKSPPDGPVARRSLTDIHADVLRQSLNDHPDDKYMGDMMSFEAQGKGLRRQSASPNFKAALGTQRTLSSSSDLQRTILKSERSKRHSSGIYYNKLRAGS